MFSDSLYYFIPVILVLSSPLLFQSLSSRKGPQTLTEPDTPCPARTHTVVILGAGMVGVPLAHHLLKHTPAYVGLRLVLVSPNDEMLWPYATVRSILPNALGDDKIFLPLGPAFSKYDASKFEHMLGTAESLDPGMNRVVVLTTADQQQRTIDYDTLVIATGSSFKGALPFKNLTDTAATKNEIHNLRNKIATAKSIVVAGAGQTGVEVAGELGQEYGLTGAKEITLIANDILPLEPDTRDDIRRTVTSELSKMKVKVTTNTRVLAVTATQAGNKQSLLLRTGGENDTDATETTLETDLYIPAFGIRPNTDFLPAAMLDGSARVKVNRETLQTESYANVFALGDASNAQTARGKHADAQVRYFAPALQDRLAGRIVPNYKADDTFIFAVTLGPYRGTGQVGNWRLWAWIIRLTIAKHLGTDHAADIAAGKRTLTQTNW